MNQQFRRGNEENYPHALGEERLFVLLYRRYARGRACHNGE
jgi:hypothetical protein